ncbi:MAG: A-type flagellin [Pseudomonadota bacterium]
MSVINTNVKALYTQNALKASARDQAVAMQQLSTGKRINSARDDAAGLAISKRMTQQIRSLEMAVKNAGDAVALIQTAEGATGAITDMMQRMRELAVQAINDTNAKDQRGYLDLEFQQLKQQIQTISVQTQWNGFSILNGTAGEPVGTRPVYKATSTGSFNNDIAYTTGTPSTSEADNSISTDETAGKFIKSGSLSVKFDATPAISAATFTLDDGSVITLDETDSDLIDFSDNEITLKAASGLVSGDVVLKQTVTADDTNADYVADQTIALRVTRTMPAITPMQANDLIINGVTIPIALSSYDSVSVSDNAAASALARASAINQMTAETGVAATVNPNIMSGTAMQSGAVMKGTISINGFTTPEISTTLNNKRETRSTVVDAINAISAQTGVRAINSGSEDHGIQLVADDGRNIEVGFNTEGLDSDFSSRTGVRQGIQIGTYSLESSVEGSMVVTSIGDWSRAGLRPADYSPNTSIFSSMTRPAVESGDTVKTLGDGDLKINGVPIRGATAADDTRSSILSTSSIRSGSAIAIANAINASTKDTGVSAVASPASLEAEAAPSNASTESAILYLNGTAVAIDLVADEDVTARLNKIITAVNAQKGQHGVEASATSDGRLKLDTVDGRNLSVWTSTDADELGLSGTDATIDEDASLTFTGATTIYGSVSLKSDKPFTLSPGDNGFSSKGDFTSLGFQEGTFGGEVDNAISKLTPPRTGRLSFHVGASAEQTIYIDLADYGSKGPITGEITGDVDLSNTEQRTNRIDSSESAKAMLSKLDVVLDRVNANRAMMGAIMNRLDYVMDNLSNVSLNTEASRSQIEDADYAKASTELARTQIMQQAATSVLAQANTDQQTVLKLLQ